jgi:putative glycosyltransferase (TIGR04372 family)
MNIFKLYPKRITNGFIAVVHAPLLLLIYIMSPLIKIRFGYFSTDRIGHFAVDLGYAIAINKEIANNKNRREVIFYYLQDEICNSQLKIIAKRELSVNQYYKYFVYAYTLLGLSSKIVIPYRHKCASRDIDGIMINFNYNISLLDKENTIAEEYLKKYGWIKGEKFVCLNVRDSAFFNESKEVHNHNAIRNSDIDDYEAAVNYLLNMGYWVVRMGRKVERPFKIKHSRLIDYGVDPNSSDLLDIWLSKNCYFFISTGTGIDSVAQMFKKPIVIVNLLPIISLLSWLNTVTMPKRLFWEKGKELSLTEHLNNNLKGCQYKEKGIKIVDLTPDEIKCGVQEMVARLNDMPLTSKNVQNQKKFWHILEQHETYSKFHNIRDLNASFALSFLDNNPDFLV